MILLQLLLAVTMAAWVSIERGGRIGGVGRVAAPVVARLVLLQRELVFVEDLIANIIFMNELCWRIGNWGRFGIWR